MCGIGDGVGGEGGERLEGRARRLAARQAVTVAHMGGERGGCVGYVSTAATASKNDVLEGRHFEIVAFRHG